jgi:signal transduction histidine kinase
MAGTTIRRTILGRLSVRTRIALACAALFLVTGAGLVAALYALVDHSLGVSGFHRGMPAGLVQACHAAKTAHTTSPQVRAECFLLGSPDLRARSLHAVLTWSLVTLPMGTVAAGMLGWAIGRRILRPLHKVTVAARRASQERLDERINFDGPEDELKKLADTFDDMLNRLDLAFASQRRFVANASHELRTPLTSMRTLIDVAMAKPARTTEQLEVLIGRVRDTLDQSEALIDGLLTLVRSDRGLTDHELVDLEAAAQDAIDQTSAPARTSNIAIAADLSPGPTLGDRVLLERLTGNLVDDAVRYNVEGGSVIIVTGPDNNASHITVTNTGPPVPESAVTSLFEPFTRLNGRVSNGQGVGLGLPIVTSVVNAHRGDLLAEALPGGGMKISVRLPRPTANVT